MYYICHPLLDLASHGACFYLAFTIKFGGKWQQVLAYFFFCHLRSNLANSANKTVFYLSFTIKYGEQRQRVLARVFYLSSKQLGFGLEQGQEAKERTFDP